MRIVATVVRRARLLLFVALIGLLIQAILPVAVSAAIPEGTDTAPAKAAQNAAGNGNGKWTAVTTPAQTVPAAAGSSSNANSIARDGDATKPSDTKPGAVSNVANNLQYYPLPYPIRLLDTRPGATACVAPGTPDAGGSSHAEPAAGYTCAGLTIPVSAVAVTGNATVVADAGGDAGFVTLYPNGAGLPLASTLNYVPGQVVPNAFTVGLGTGGGFREYTSTTIDFVVDLNGYYAPVGAGLYYHPLPFPIRFLDTRPGQVAFNLPGTPDQGGQTYFSGVAGISYAGVTIPANVAAIVGNATVVADTGSGAGFATLFPGGNSLPLASNLNYVPGLVIPNAFTVGLGLGGFNVYASTTINLVIDISGYYSSSSSDNNGAGLLYNTLASPYRLLDTRFGSNACLGGGGPHLGGTSYIDFVTGAINGIQSTCPGLSIPSNAIAVTGNATVVADASGGPGFVTLYPGNASRPNASNLNYIPGTVAPNFFIVGLGAATANDGTTYTKAYRIYSSTTVNEVVDLTGYFA